MMHAWRDAASIYFLTGLNYFIWLTRLISSTYLKLFVLSCFLANANSFLINQNSKHRVHIKAANILRKIKKMKFYFRQLRKQTQSYDILG